MIFVLSGEGPTDIGKLDYSTQRFLPGWMGHFIDCEVKGHVNFSPLETYQGGKECIRFVPKQELSRGKRDNAPVLPGKKRKRPGGAFFTKAAALLGGIAKSYEGGGYRNCYPVS